MPSNLFFAVDLADVSPETTIAELLARFSASPATPPVTPKLLPPPQAMSELHDIDRRMAALEQIAVDSRQALFDIRTGIDGLRAGIERYFYAVDRRFTALDRGSEPEQAVHDQHEQADIAAQPVPEPPVVVHGCTFEGCGNTTEKPTLNGWAWLAEWGPGVRDGFYCREHVEALEALLHERKIIGLARETPRRKSRLNRPNATLRPVAAADKRKPQGRGKATTPPRRKAARQELDGAGAASPKTPSRAAGHEIVGAVADPLRASMPDHPTPVKSVPGCGEAPEWG